MNKKRIIFLIGLGFTLAVNLYLRSFPIYFPQLKAEARKLVENNIRQLAGRDVQQMAPYYDPKAKEKILRSRVKQYIKQNKKEIKSQTDKLYRQLKDRFQDNTGQTYMMELDCWNWARYVENVLKRGRPGDETIFGKEWERYMLAPEGFYMWWQNFLYYLSAGLYKFFSLFRNVKLYSFLFYLPLFFMAVFASAVYTFSYKYSGNIGAIIGCLFVGLAPIFLHRSCAGWFDTDILNLLFPILIVWTYSNSYRGQPFRRRLLWLFLSGLCVGLFSFTWTFWWFIFGIIFLCESVHLFFCAINHFYFKRENLIEIKEHLASIFYFFIFGVPCILIISGKEPIRALYPFLRLAISLTTPLVASIWPNVLYTVGELRKSDIFSVARSLGGMWIFVPIVTCMPILLFRAVFRKAYSKSKTVAIMILCTWFAVMLFASFKGVRFIMFLLLPLGICAGWLIDDIYGYFRHSRNLAGALLLSLVLLMGGTRYFNNGYKSAKGIYPLMNDRWYRVLNIIREKTPEDAILNSWWDFGDWFKVVARRRCIFDGQSHNYPQAYWMAKAILANSKEQAVAILRMLNNGGNRAFKTMNEHIKDPLEAVLLLETVMVQEPDIAGDILKSYLPPGAVKNVMSLLFSKPVSAYFIVDDTMVGKIGAISYLGNWDFSKVYIAQNLNAKEEHKILDRLTELGKDKNLMQKFYQEAFLITQNNLNDWLSGGLQFYSALVNGKEAGDAVIFDNGFIYKPKEKIIYSKDGYVPRSLFIFEDNDVKEIIYDKPNVIYSALVSRDDETGVYKCILLDRQLGKSVFSRLYFFKGKGFKHFESFIDAEDGNRYIRVHYINW